MDALQILRDDHRHVKDLFRRFEEADSTRAKGRIVAEALTALEIHAEIEEAIFYPAVRREADADRGEMDEAEEEHHVVKLLIGELRDMKPGAARYDAKFTVLAENVKHHIEEEESEMLPKAAELGMQRMNELGAAMEARRLQLANGAARKSRSSARASAMDGKPGPRGKASRPTPSPASTSRAKSKTHPVGRAARRTTTGKASPSGRLAGSRRAASFTERTPTGNRTRALKSPAARGAPARTRPTTTRKAAARRK